MLQGVARQYGTRARDAWAGAIVGFTVFLVQLVDTFRAMPFRRHPSQPNVREFRQPRPRVGTDPVRVNYVRYNMRESDDREKKECPGGERERAKLFDDGHEGHGWMDAGAL